MTQGNPWSRSHSNPCHRLVYGKSYCLFRVTAAGEETRVRGGPRQLQWAAEACRLASARAGHAVRFWRGLALSLIFISRWGAGSVDGIIGGEKEESRQWDGGSSVEIRCIISFIFSDISMWTCWCITYWWYDNQLLLLMPYGLRKFVPIIPSTAYEINMWKNNNVN